MIRARASIATLLVIVGLLAVGFAALRVSSRLWANSCFSVALLSLVVAIAGLIHRRGRPRAFWGGFALFGWAYFLIAFGPSPFNTWKGWLASEPALSILEEQLLERPAPAKAVGMGTPSAASRISSRVSSTGYSELSPWSYWTDTDRSNPFSSDSFNRIGHSLFCLGIAIGGGVFCRYLHDSRDSPGPSP